MVEQHLIPKIGKKKKIKYHDVPMEFNPGTQKYEVDAVTLKEKIKSFFKKKNDK